MEVVAPAGREAAVGEPAVLPEVVDVEDDVAGSCLAEGVPDGSPPVRLPMYPPPTPGGSGGNLVEDGLGDVLELDGLLRLLRGRGAGGEIQLTDGIADLLDESPVYAYSFSGIRYDCGSKLGYLQATVAFGLEHEDTGTAFRDYLKALVCD